MCTLGFLKQVLSGNRSLLKVSEINGIPKIPRIPEINAGKIWTDIRGEERIAVYFPENYTVSNRVPDREYMFTVV